MRAADVMMALARDCRLSWEPGPGNTEAAAWRAWCALVDALKPGAAKLPMSPLEVQRARVVLAVLRDALDQAERANPSHFCDVADLTPDRQADTDDEDELGTASSRSERQ